MAEDIKVADQQYNDHEDVKAIGNNEDAFYVWECRNTTIGPDAILNVTRLAKSVDVAKFMARNYFPTHPHLVLDKSKGKDGFQAFPNRFAAEVEAKRRNDRYNLNDPSRINASEIYPGEPNRILEAGKPDEHPDIAARQ